MKNDLTSVLEAQLDKLSAVIRQIAPDSSIDAETLTAALEQFKAALVSADWTVASAQSFLSAQQAVLDAMNCDFRTMAWYGAAMLVSDREPEEGEVDAILLALDPATAA